MSSNRAVSHEISTNFASTDPMPTDAGLNSKQDSQVDIEKADYDGEPKVLEASAVPHLDPIREKKLTRKLDLYLIPIFCLLYLMCFLDRANIGNANVAEPSISESLGLSSTQFAACVTVVYATYVVFEPVWTNLLKIVTPRIMLAASTASWGALTIGTAWAKDYKDLIIIRLLVGLFEAGLFPCLAIYIMMTYRRDEVGKRMSYLYTCIAMSGAFGGLIAYGLFQISNDQLHGWQFLYIVEGILSFALAPIAYFWIPNHVDTAWFLTADEKEAATIRYQINKAMYDPQEKFSWRPVIAAMKDWKTWTTGVIQFCGNIPLYGFSTFLPAIIRGMGHSYLNSQLLTVPVYLTGAVTIIIMARLADKMKLRSPFIVVSFFLQIIGYIVLVSVAGTAGRYVGCFIVATGLYGVACANVPWISNNTAGHYKRTTSVGMNQLIGNCAGAAIGFIFIRDYAPRYLVSFYVTMGLACLGIVLTVCKAYALHCINKKREILIANGALDQPELGDQNPHFKYYL